METTIDFSQKATQGMSYTAYRSLVTEAVAAGATTGPNQSEALIRYTHLNDHRMNRLDKTVALLPELTELLQRIDRDQLWLVLTEGWCGDAAQNLPVMHKMAESSPRIDFRLLLRDEHPDLMDAYLTNGGRSIPKLIMLDKATFTEIGQWGPRPAPVQEMVLDFKAHPNGRVYDDVAREAQTWYARDKTHTFQQEFITLLQSL